VVANPGVEALARQFEIFPRHLNILASYFHLVPGCLKVQQGPSHVSLDLRAKVFELSLTLRQGSLSLLDVPFDPAALPDWKLEAADYRERSVSLRRVDSDSAIIGAERKGGKAFRARSCAGPLGSPNLRFGRLQIRTLSRSLLESVFHVDGRHGFEWDVVGDVILVGRRQACHSRQVDLLFREILLERRHA